MDKALETMIVNMPEKTGKSLLEWKMILKSEPFTKHSEMVTFLKTTYKLTHGYANTIALLFKNEENTPNELVEQQYMGKENLLPIYHKLLSVINQLGTDITVTPKKQNVSVIRKKQFALIQPSTKTRIDLGLKIKNKPHTERLLDSGPFGSMCTHRVKLSELSEINDELILWITEAYHQNN